MMLGALHIEDKIHQMTGKLLRDSGGTTVLSQAQVLPSGRAQSALNEHHIKRTLCIVSCDGPHKLCKMVVNSCEGYVSAV